MDCFLGILEGELSIAGGDNALAIEQLREAIKHGNLFQAHESLAFAYESDGQYEQAVEELNWLIEHRGQLFAEYLSDFFGREHSILDWVVAHFRLAQVSEKMGKPQIAVQNYKKLMQHWRQADAHIPIRQLAEQRLIELNGSDQISVSPGT